MAQQLLGPTLTDELFRKSMLDHPFEPTGLFLWHRLSGLLLVLSGGFEPFEPSSGLMGLKDVEVTHSIHEGLHARPILPFEKLQLPKPDSTPSLSHIVDKTTSRNQKRRSKAVTGIFFLERTLYAEDKVPQLMDHVVALPVSRSTLVEDNGRNPSVDVRFDSTGVEGVRSGKTDHSEAVILKTLGEILDGIPPNLPGVAEAGCRLFDFFNRRHSLRKFDRPLEIHPIDFKNGLNLQIPLQPVSNPL